MKEKKSFCTVCAGAPYAPSQEPCLSCEEGSRWSFMAARVPKSIQDGSHLVKPERGLVENRLDQLEHDYRAHSKRLADLEVVLLGPDERDSRDPSNT